MKKSLNNANAVLGALKPSKAVVKLAVPATLALLAKAVYNIVDTAYIGMLHSDSALAAVGVTLPILLISEHQWRFSRKRRSMRSGCLLLHLQIFLRNV